MDATTPVVLYYQPPEWEIWVERFVDGSVRWYGRREDLDATLAAGSREELIAKIWEAALA